MRWLRKPLAEAMIDGRAPLYYASLQGILFTTILCLRRLHIVLANLKSSSENMDMANMSVDCFKIRHL